MKGKLLSPLFNIRNRSAAETHTFSETFLAKFYSDALSMPTNVLPKFNIKSTHGPMLTGNCEIVNLTNMFVALTSHCLASLLY